MSASGEAEYSPHRAGRANAVGRRPRRMERMLYRALYRSWFQGKDFSSDWTSSHFALWSRVLAPLRREGLRILEIGSWEGRSALFFLNFFERSTLVCIDTFSGNSAERTYIAGQASEQLSLIEGRFDRNVAQFPGRVEKIKSESGAALARLAALARQFDLAYIDGSHLCDDVAADSAAAWQLLAPRGVVIWDDYEFGPDLPPAERPRPAIDSFLNQHEGHYRLLAKVVGTNQVIIERQG